MDTLKLNVVQVIKQYKFVALILAIGLVLMLLPDSNQQKDIPMQTSTQSISTPEERLESILSQIQGVGKVKVMLTVAQGEQTLYIYDENRSDTSDTASLRKEAVVITDKERAQSGLVSQVIPPVYRGAVIVCQGGDLPGVKLAVVEAVCDATGLTADKITVLKMK